MSCERSALHFKLRRTKHSCNPECVVNDEFDTEAHREPWEGVVIGDGTFKIGVPVTVTPLDHLRYWWHLLMEASL